MFSSVPFPDFKLQLKILILGLSKFQFQCKIDQNSILHLPSQDHGLFIGLGFDEMVQFGVKKVLMSFNTPNNFSHAQTLVSTSLYYKHMYNYHKRCQSYNHHK